MIKANNTNNPDKTGIASITNRNEKVEDLTDEDFDKSKLKFYNFLLNRF
jgi:hypothetical protein